MRYLALLAVAIAAVPATAQLKPKPGATPAADKLICKSSAPIGSMIPSRKECHTRAEWNQIARNARDDAQEQRDRSMGGGSPTG